MANSDYIDTKCRNILKKLLDIDLTCWIEHYFHFQNHEITTKCNKLNNYLIQFVEKLKEMLSDKEDRIITGKVLREYLLIIYFMYLKDLNTTQAEAIQIKKLYDENCDLNHNEPLLCKNDVLKYPLVYALLCMLYVPKSSNPYLKKQFEKISKDTRQKMFFCNYVCKKECYPNMIFLTLDKEEIEKIIDEL